MATCDLTAQRLRELLSYDAAAGQFTWLKTGKGRRLDLSAGGQSSHGYVKINIEGFGQQYAHRLAWLYMTGEWPTCEVDHINGNRTDNRWGNLRDGASSVNQQNKRSPQSNNKSGFLGVSLNSSRTNCPSKWLAQIALPGGKRIVIGNFKTPEEAHQAYLNAKRRLHKGCTI